MPRKNADFEKALDEISRKAGFDGRAGVLDVAIEAQDGDSRLVGTTTRPDLVDELTRRLGGVADAVRRLPDDSIGAERFALVRSALAPVHAEPRVSAGQFSQYVLGHRLDLLEERERWWRVRGEDGYVAWVHEGYLIRCDAETAQAWERGEDGEAVVSLGGILADEAERPFALVPWGARLVRESGDRFRMPDGRTGTLLDGGEIVAADRLADRFPARGESILRTARRWLGAPYVWGGVVPSGTDCSGFVQSVYWMHGIALPRDSDLQALLGQELKTGKGFASLRAGDLLFFAEGGDRITHVGISTGGPGMIHCSLSNGGAAENDLTGDSPVEAMLRGTFRTARRVLPD